MRTLLALVALLAVPALHAEPARYRIDPEHFSIAFLIEHVGYARIMGQFTQASGEFVYDEQNQKLQSGTVEVRAASIATHHAKRDEHLRNADFLNAATYPLIRFVATRFDARSDASGVLRGDLTMLDRTHPVELEIKLNKAAPYPFGHRKHTLGFSATATIERSRWGMDYGVAEKMVGDEVELLFEFEAIRE